MGNTSDKNKVKGNDDSDVHNDEIGENTGEDTLVSKAVKSNTGVEDKAKQASSNKGQGPSGENL